MRSSRRAIGWLASIESIDAYKMWDLRSSANETFSQFDFHWMFVYKAQSFVCQLLVKQVAIFNNQDINRILLWFTCAGRKDFETTGDIENGRFELICLIVSHWPVCHGFPNAKTIKYGRLLRKLLLRICGDKGSHCENSHNK